MTMFGKTGKGKEGGVSASIALIAPSEKSDGIAHSVAKLAAPKGSKIVETDRPEVPASRLVGTPEDMTSRGIVVSCALLSKTVGQFSRLDSCGKRCKDVAPPACSAFLNWREVSSSK